MVVVANDMSTQGAIRLDRNHVLVFVSETGTEFSHAAILAKYLHLHTILDDLRVNLLELNDPDKSEALIKELLKEYSPLLL